jgi:cation diffusion facilitator CzcD-associated flavoprotein CzcO
MGVTNPLVFALPGLILLILVGGVIAGLVMRRRAPGRYARLAESSLRPQARTLPRPAQWTRRYCLIGAGPAGLVMGRRLLDEGVPFDWYDAGTGVGGMWDPSHPGSPLHETLTMVTSKHTSAFADFPMPAHFPDYPHWWQTHEYLRSYADYHGLTPHIQFGTTVTWANPQEPGWSVTLSTGTFRYYSGVIAAPGTTWRPTLPTWPGQERFRGQIVHSCLYKAPAQLAGRRVLVVGAGASAVEIACEAARASAATFLSVRHGRRIRPKHLYGVPTDALLTGRASLGDASSQGNVRELIAATVGDVTRLGLPKPDPSAHAGHPVATDDLLPLLAEGLIQARGDIVEIYPDGVRFADGSVERVDLIIAATGYERQVPFLDPRTYTRDGALDLYLNVFSRSHEGLSLLGLVDLGGPAFPRYDDQARAVMVDINLRELGGVERRAWRSMLSTHPDMRGGIKFADTPARAFTVDDGAYSTQLRDLCDRFGYPPGGSWGGAPGAAAPEPAQPGLGAALRASQR